VNSGRCIDVSGASTADGARVIQYSAGPTYINARMQDGVIGISQYDPSSNWGRTIQSVRSQLGTPKICP
jgi:hypothetical protein